MIGDRWVMSARRVEELQYRYSIMAQALLRGRDQEITNSTNTTTSDKALHAEQLEEKALKLGVSLSHRYLFT